jgi:hypothetical protein
MNWDRVLLVIALVGLLLIVGVSMVEPWVLASSLAEQLATRIGADEDVIRHHIQEILNHQSTLRRAAVYSFPLAIIIVALLARIVMKGR